MLKTAQCDLSPVHINYRCQLLNFVLPIVLNGYDMQVIKIYGQCVPVGVYKYAAKSMVCCLSTQVSIWVCGGVTTQSNCYRLCWVAWNVYRRQC